MAEESAAKDCITSDRDSRNWSTLVFAGSDGESACDRLKNGRNVENILHSILAASPGDVLRARRQLHHQYSHERTNGPVGLP
jgi:hypothetical protein